MVEKIVGKKYGKLTVLPEVKKISSGHKYVICRCDCGKNKVVKRSNLLSGNTTHCGCQRSTTTRKAKENLKQARTEVSELFLLGHARKRKKRKLSLLDHDDCIEIGLAQARIYAASINHPSVF